MLEVAWGQDRFYAAQGGAAQMALLIRKLDRGAWAARWLPRGVMLWALVIGLAWTTLAFAQDSQPTASAAANPATAAEAGSIPTRNLLGAVRDGGPS
jgi:hypothetical protein